MRDLYYNTPARRKFLKSEATEFAHCAEAVKRIALAHPEVAFTLAHNGRVSLHLMKSDDFRSRVGAILGDDFLAESRPLDVLAGPLRVTGFCALPAHSRARSDAQYCYVNGRFVRDKLLVHALREAYQDHAARQPLPGLLRFPGNRPGDCRRQCASPKTEVRFRDCTRRSPVRLSRRATASARQSAGGRQALKRSKTPWAAQSRLPHSARRTRARRQAANLRTAPGFRTRVRYTWRAAAPRHGWQRQRLPIAFSRHGAAAG
jgi:hypothetical protein